MTICIHANATELPASAPDWVHLVPAGSFRGRDGRGPYQIDPKRVIDASKDALQSESAVVDYGHELWSGPMNGAAARNAGFIRELDARQDGIWARVEWTSAAKHALAEREYRGISPVFSHDKAGNVLKLLGAGLTNKPNLELVSFNSEQGVIMSLAQRLAAALGLTDAASEDDIVTHATAIKAKVSELDTKLTDATKRADEASVALQSQKSAAETETVTLQSQITSLQSQVKSLLGDKISGEIDDAIKAGRVLPAERDHFVALSSEAPALYRKMIDARPVIVQMGQMVPNGAPKAEDAGDPEIAKMCKALGLSKEAYTKSAADIAARQGAN